MSDFARRILGPLVMGVAFGLLSVNGFAEAQETDEELIEGTWEVVAYAMAGQPAPHFVGQEWRFEDGELQSGDYGDLPLAYRLDPSQMPAEIDIILLPGRHDMEISHEAIYFLDGDQLTLCINPAKLPQWRGRPTAFDGGEGRLWKLITLRRQVADP